MSITDPQIIENAPRHDVLTTPRRWTVLIAVLALLVGGVGGYVLRRGTAPEKTNTVTKTVYAPAFATGLEQTGYVYYDGAHAYYSGRRS